MLATLFCVSLVNKSVAGEYVNFVGMKFVDIPQGSFFMGSCGPGQSKSSRKSCPGSKFFIKHRISVPADESPRHEVRLTKMIQVGVFEVTVAQFEEFLQKKHADLGTSKHIFTSINRGDKDSNALPVRYVSWHDAQRFIAWINADKPADDKGLYRLPTEAEWEYAARAGTDTIFFFGNDASKLGKFAWYADNNWKKKILMPHKVGESESNPWGIYDMYGNVGEWVQDSYDEGFYKTKYSHENPVNEKKSVFRVIRGGAWNHDDIFCRSAVRSSYPASQKSSFIGFRVVRELPLQ